MPGATQVKVGSVPCPPAAWSLRFSSKIARYSGVSGADLASGQRGAAVRSHWPFKSGYLDSSNAWPLVTINRSPATGAATRATARAPEPIGLRQRIYVLLEILMNYPAEMPHRSTHGTSSRSCGAIAFTLPHRSLCTGVREG